MGVLGMIAKAKGKFHQRKMDVLEGRTSKIREENLREAERTKAKQELREVQQIRADLRADQEIKVDAGPNKLQKLGMGMAKHIDKGKGKGKSGAFMSGPKFGAIPSTGSKGMQMGGGGSPFGGTRPLDVGGGGINFGPTPKAKQEKKKTTTIIIKQ